MYRKCATVAEARGKYTRVARWILLMMLVAEFVSVQFQPYYMNVFPQDGGGSSANASELTQSWAKPFCTLTVKITTALDNIH